MKSYYWVGTTSDYFDVQNWHLEDTHVVPDSLPTYRDKIIFDDRATGDCVLDGTFWPIVNTITIADTFAFAISTTNDTGIKVVGKVENNKPENVLVEIELFDPDALINAMYIYYLLQDGTTIRGDAILAKDENNIDWLYRQVVGAEFVSNKGQPDGYAPLGPDGKIPGMFLDLDASITSPLKQVFAVSESDGDDDTGDGSDIHPFKTIDKAIDAGPADMTGYAIKVYPGTYPACTICKPGITLLGVFNASCKVDEVRLSLCDNINLSVYGLTINKLVVIDEPDSAVVCSAAFNSCDITFDQEAWPTRIHSHTFNFEFSNCRCYLGSTPVTTFFTPSGVTKYSYCTMDTCDNNYNWFFTPVSNFEYCRFQDLKLDYTALNSRFDHCTFDGDCDLSMVTNRMLACQFEGSRVNLSGTTLSVIDCNLQNINGSYAYLSINTARYTLSETQYSAARSQLIGFREHPSTQDQDITSDVVFQNISPVSQYLNDILKAIDMSFGSGTLDLTTDDVFTVKEFPLIGTEYGIYNPTNPVPQDITLTEMFEGMFLRIEPPTYTAPTLVLSSNNSVYKAELGTTATINFTTNFNQADAGNLTTYSLLRDAVTIKTGSTLPDIVPDTITYTELPKVYSSTANYAEGPIKPDNTGTPSPDGHILAGTITSNQLTYRGARVSFGGGILGRYAPSTPTQIRALSTRVLDLQPGGTVNFTIAQGQQTGVFAYPATLPEIDKIIYTVMTADYTDVYEVMTMDVPGANSYTSVTYRIYYMPMDIPAEADMTFTARLKNV